MMRTQVRPVAPPDQLRTTRDVAQRLRDVAAARAEEALAELPAIARRLRTLLLVLAISIPVSLAALIAVIWLIAR